MAIEYYSSIDLNKNELQNAVIQNAGSAPGSPAEGQIYYDSTSGDKALHFYNGSAWIRVAGQATAQATDTIASGDFMAFSDESETGDINNKITIDNLFKTAPALLTEAAVADGDYIVFLDGGASGDAKKEALADLATLFAGTGLGASSSVLSIDAAQTGITSLLATDIKIGEDDQTKIDFETADEIHFYAANVEQVYLGDNIFGPQSDSDVDLGSSSVRWKDAYVDSITVTGEIDGASLDISGNADIDGTLEADAITVNGTSLSDTIAGTTVTNATNAAHVLITDNESTDEENEITFIEGAGGGGANRGLEADGDFTYNPSSGTVSATVFKGNIDAVDGDFDGTLEADAITVGGTNILTGGIITTLGTIAQDTVTFSSANASDPLINILNTTNDTNGARLRFTKDRGAAGTDGAEVGRIEFYGDDDGQNLTEWARIAGYVSDASNTAEGGKLILAVATHDGEMQTGLLLEDGNAEDEIDVTIGKGSSSLTTIAGLLTVTGNLTVNGTTTTVNSTTTTLDDPIFTLGGDTAPESDDNKDRGIEFRYHDGSAAKIGFFGWDDSATGFTGFSAATNSSEVFSGTVMNCTFGVGTFASLDISGNADIDGTMEADAYTVNGTALAEYISDTVGAMVGSNTETGISVTYADGDNTLDFALSAAQTTITSLLATDIKIGEDDQTKIDFETADEIHFYAANVEQVYLADNIFGPQSDSDVDLGSNGVRWKDAYMDNLYVTSDVDINGDVDVDGTLETDALTIAGTAIVAQATASAVGGVELATAAEVITGTDAARVVTADTLSAKSVVCDIDVSSLTDANIVTITHNLGTADILVQVYDKTTEANIMCDIARTTDDFSTASTSVVSIDFGTAPPNDCRALITSLAGATAGSIAYT